MSFEEVEIENISHVKVEGFGNKSLNMMAEIKLNNPNFFSIELLDSEFDLYVDNQKIGVGRIISDLKLPGHSNDYYDVKIESEFKSLNTSTLLSLLQGSIFAKEKVPFKVEGMVKGKALMITKSIDLEYSGEVPIKI